MSDRTDILNFEFSTRRIRDIGIIEPVLSYLELKFELITKRYWVLDNFPEIIDRENPKMIVMANGIGTTEHFEIVKYAKLKGIKVVTMISEGDMVDMKENVEILFWGNNTERKMYEDANFQWSKKNIDLVRKYIDPDKKLNIRLSGGTGFDRYQFLPLMQKKTFLEKYGFDGQYKDIIGLAGFPFYFFLSDMYKKDGAWINMHLDIEACEIMATLKDDVKDLYEQLIQKNPDKLFILKYHPMELYKEYSEFFGLNKYPNTIEILMEEKIEDIISVSDLWIAFESTTCLEAWLLHKETIIVNPLDKKFVRSEISAGSPFCINIEELGSMVDEFFSRKETARFKQLENKRKEIIEYVIGFGDGMNHTRAANAIFEILQELSNPITPNEAEITRIRKKYANIHLRKKIRNIVYRTPLVYLPKIRKIYAFEKDRANEFIPALREEFRMKYRKALKEFHKL